MSSGLLFDISTDRLALAPPEARGLQRDEVRLLVATGSSVHHARFDELPRWLDPGDLIVVNTSPTMNAAVDAELASERMVVHFSSMQSDRRWTVELRRIDGTGPILDATAGSTVELVGGGGLELLEPVAGQGSTPRLWSALVSVPGGVAELLRTRGRPIRYQYVQDHWPSEAYQTIFADPTQWPGSAEMPSAGRPFTWSLVRRLRRAGVGVTGISLHTGVSSQESHEPPQPERYHVPEETARAIGHARRFGTRVIAVGTTVTRALETVGQPDGTIEPGQGWTDLVIAPDRPMNVVDSLVTGWHMPASSHLDLLQAVAGTDIVSEAYREALQHGYLWHEFGDACLLHASRQAVTRAA